MSTLSCLVIMPFESSFDAIFQLVRDTAQTAITEHSIECWWLKDVRAAGRITDDIIDGIERSALCIADVTHSNANVMWETGYAMALGKPTVLIGQSVSNLPFDLKVHRVLAYNPQDGSAMREPLAEAIRQTMARHVTHSTKVVPWNHAAPTRVIAVTGTMRAHPASVQRRVESTLPPYLRSGVTWLCGSNGITDELIVDYLVAHGEQVYVVGYHAYDRSDHIQQLITRAKLAFVDASTESLVRGIAAPSDRDLLFSMKADLVILFWDGASKGIKRTHLFLMGIGKSTLLAQI